MAGLYSIIKVPPEEKTFYNKTFSYVAKRRKAERSDDDILAVVAEEYDALSKRVDATKIQESCSIRNVLRTRELAKLLIDEQGNLKTDLLPRTIEVLEKHLYSIGPERQYDAKRQEQIIRVVKMLQEDKKLVRLLHSVTRPHQHKIADQIIRYTLNLPSHEGITDAHARQAALAAWMCYLRQNVGSCFATAPAIIVHNEQPKQFLEDISEILSTGRLKRTFGGVEYTVPLSPSWGNGDLKRPILMENNGKQISPKVWQSPALIAALEVTELFDAKESLRHKVKRAKKIITGVLDAPAKEQPFFLINSEKILQRVLMQHFQITPQDLEEYESRPQEVIQTGLLVHAHEVPKGKGYAHYYLQLDHAKNVFKSLEENALLKSWEFTVASFAETKAAFTRWNLYSSLGLKPEENGGIGATLYTILQDKLQQYNSRVHELQQEYEALYTQVKYMEGRMRRASTEQELKWLKIEYQSRSNEFHSVEEMRDEANQKAKKIANLYNVLMDHYDVLFPQYFQEVYDADMHDVESGPYDDSPAGFRLMYKHGRANTSLWTMIHNPNEFIEALISFFTTTETEVASLPELEGMQDVLTEIITAVVNHIRTKEFLETAFHRMALAHKTRPIENPLEHLDQIKKKPWVYTSGGVMSTLVSCYFRRDQKPTDVDRWVESPTELLIFLIDTIKQIPPKLSQEFYRSSRASLLMHSPTHAFLLKPKFQPFMDACLNEDFTYTWVRDHIISKMQNFVFQLKLSEEMTDFLFDRLKERIPDAFRHHFSRRNFRDMYGEITPKIFREQVLEYVQQNRQLRVLAQSFLGEEELDRFLYSMLPLFRTSDLKRRLTEILGEFNQELGGRKVQMEKEIENICDHIGDHRIFSAEMLRNLCKSLLCFVLDDTSFPADYHWSVSQAARKHGYTMPMPIIFADTNWVKDHFAFLINPGTEELEFWRVDYTGTRGAPMTSWKMWVNGSRKDATWGVYTHSYEYTS